MTRQEKKVVTGRVEHDLCPWGESYVRVSWNAEEQKVGIDKAYIIPLGMSPSINLYRDEFEAVYKQLGKILKEFKKI